MCIISRLTLIPPLHFETFCCTLILIQACVLQIYMSLVDAKQIRCVVPAKSLSKWLDHVNDVRIFMLPPRWVIEKCDRGAVWEGQDIWRNIQKIDMKRFGCGGAQNKFVDMIVTMCGRRNNDGRPAREQQIIRGVLADTLLRYQWFQYS